MLSALRDRTELLLLPEDPEEVDEVHAGEQVVGLGIAFVQPPVFASGQRSCLKVLTVVS